MLANVLAAGIVLVRPVANTHSCMHIKISSNEVVQEKNGMLTPIFCPLRFFTSSHRIKLFCSSTHTPAYLEITSFEKKAKEFLTQTRHVLTLVSQN